MKKIFRVSFYFFIAVFALTIAKTVRAEGIPPELPSPDAVLQNYRDNPYLRFYEGNEGIAWTTVHPGGYAVTGNGTYIYAGGQSIYRGEEGTTVVPPGVVTRREIAGELPYGHHYYAAPVTDSVIPVGKWVLEHSDARCVHGPFDACSGYEYYGIDIARLIERISLANKASESIFTPRELDVIRLSCKGLQYKEIAGHLGIKYLTVVTIKNNIFRKLGINNTVELVVYAIKKELISL